MDWDNDVFPPAINVKLKVELGNKSKNGDFSPLETDSNNLYELEEIDYYIYKSETRLLKLT
ncbi:MAG: hypothetical protein F6K17_19185 [Okeania sp. SIO3C4]|nr:hypothetical protein [Okeania sp. SIO3C4]